VAIVRRFVDGRGTVTISFNHAIEPSQGRVGI
jgi:hypothetical protein